MDEYFENKFKELIELHNECSEALKLIEDLITEFDTTTLNDIRYALRAALDALQAAIEGDRENFDKAFGSAMLAVRIVWHDSVDITKDEVKIYLDELAEINGPEIVAQFVDTTEIRKSIYKIEDAARKSRGNRLEREDIYREICLTDLQDLLELYRACHDKESEITAASKKEKEKGLKEKRRDFYQKLGVVFSGSILLIALYKLF